MSLKVTSKMTHTGRHLYKGSSLFYRTEIHRTETVKWCIREQLDQEEQLEIKYVKPLGIAWKSLVALSIYDHHRDI